MLKVALLHTMVEVKDPTGNELSKSAFGFRNINVSNLLRLFFQ